MAAAAQVQQKNLFVFDGSSRALQALSEVSGAPSLGPTENSHSVKFSKPADMKVLYLEKGKCYYAKLTTVSSIDFTREIDFYQQQNPPYSPEGVANSLFEDLSASSHALIDYSAAKVTIWTKEKQQFVPFENPFCEMPLYHSYTIDSLKYLNIMRPAVQLRMCPGNSCYFSSGSPATLKLQRDSGGNVLEPIDMSDVVQITIEGAGGAALIQQLYTSSEDEYHRRVFTYAIDSTTRFTATIKTLTRQDDKLADYLTFSSVPEAAPSGTQNPVKEALAKISDAPMKSKDMAVTRFYYNGEPPNMLGGTQISLFFDYTSPPDISFVTVSDGKIKTEVVRDVVEIDFPEGADAAATDAYKGLHVGTSEKCDTSLFPLTVVTVYYGRTDSSCATPSVSPSVEIAMTVTSAGEAVSVSMDNLPNKDASGKTAEVPLEVSFERSPPPLDTEGMNDAHMLMMAANAKTDPTKAKSAYAGLYDSIGLRTANIKPTKRVRAGLDTRVYFTPSLSPESRGPTYVDSDVFGQCRLPVKRQSLLMSTVTKSSSISLRLSAAAVKDFFALPGRYTVRVLAAGELVAEQAIYLNSPDPSEAVAAAVAEANKAAGVKLPSDTLLPVQYLARRGTNYIDYGSPKSFTLTPSDNAYLFGTDGRTLGSMEPEPLAYGSVQSAAKAFALVDELSCLTRLAAPSCSCEGSDFCMPVLVLPKTA